MHLHTRNVNSAFNLLVSGIHSGEIPTVKESSRNGSVLRVEEPVTVTYSHPKERVLFNRARDCNPMSLLYEALWMLAGRNDVAPLAFYTKQFNEYSDDGETLNGSYGYRWRKSTIYHEKTNGGPWIEEQIDQLDIIAAHLKAQPNSRRAVLSMWNVPDDLLKIDTSKDVSCNTQVMFSLRDERQTNESASLRIGREAATGKFKVLDITVINRSNDLVWGLLGANYVTFSILLEYMAARIGVEVGKYHHFTNNLHTYDWNFKPKEWLADTTPDFYSDANLSGVKGLTRKDAAEFWGKDFSPLPLVNNPEIFEKEVVEFVEQFSGKQQVDDLADYWTEPFLHDVAQPMMVAWACHKVKDYHGAFACCAGIEATDWRLACEQWLRKRLRQWESQKEVAR